MKKALSVLILMSTFIYAFTQKVNYSEGDTLNVVAMSGLKLREKGNLNSKAISSMKFADKVIVLRVRPNEVTEKEIVEGFSGIWIKVKYGTSEGYAFDGFLSSLPILKSKYEKNDNESGEQSYLYMLELILKDYLNKEFYPVQEVIKYSNGIDGEQASSFIMQKLNKGLTMIKSGGWESGGFELQMTNTRLSEIKNLLIQIGNNGIKTDEFYKKLKVNISKISEKGINIQDLYQIDDFNIKIINAKCKADNLSWNITFDWVSS
jgi:Bacterial SH3 domain